MAQEFHNPLIEAKLKSKLLGLSHSQGRTYHYRSSRSYGSTTGTTSEAPVPDIPHLVSGLGFLALFISVAIVIVIIAFVISKMRRKKEASSSSEDSDDADSDNGITIDPYMQAIVFPRDPKPQWRRYIKTTIKTAGQKLAGKGDPPHKTTIPEHMRHQLKHIYVY